MRGPRPILFGKLPSHGDFVARNLDQPGRAAWDRWASLGLQRARGELQEGYESAHDLAPPWRFVGGPGVFGSGWRAGAVAASVDAAGRRFVIALAIEGLSAEAAAAHGEVIAEAMETMIYRAFESRWSADELIGEAESAWAEPGDSARPGQVAAERWWTLGRSGRDCDIIEGEPEDLIARMLRPAAAEVVHE